MTSLEQRLVELESAEDFLNYFDIPFDTHVVQVNRLHILQRFHDYLTEESMPDGEVAQTELYKQLLHRAYKDFLKSDARSEKVFKVFHAQEAQEVFVPIETIFK